MKASRVSVLIVLAGLLVAALLVDALAPSDGRHSAALASSVGPIVPPSDTASSAWFCAGGTANPGGGADETLVIGNLSDRALHAIVTVTAGPNHDASAQRSVPLPPRARVRLPVSQISPTANPGVIVEVLGGPAIVEHELVGNGDVGLGACATEAAPSWHFAAGTTVKGAQLWLSLFNPFGDDAIVDLSFLTDQGPRAPEELKGIVVPQRSRVQIPIHEHLRRTDVVATDVETRTGKVVAEQSLVFDGTDGRRGLTLSLGLPGPRADWTFPAGSAGAAETLYLSNPDTAPATVEVDVVLDGVARLAPEQVAVAGRSVVTVDLKSRVPKGVGFWVGVHSRGGTVVAEELSSLPTPAVATATGIADAWPRWALDRLGGDSTDTLAVVNPGPHEARLSVHAIHDGVDARVGGSIPLSPGRRFVIDLRSITVPADAAVVLDATGPVFAESESSAPSGFTRSTAIVDP